MIQHRVFPIAALAVITLTAVATLVPAQPVQDSEVAPGGQVEPAADRMLQEMSTFLGQAEPTVAFVAEAAVQGRQTRAEPDRSTREQDVLDGGHQGLELGLSA